MRGDQVMATEWRLVWRTKDALSVVDVGGEEKGRAKIPGC